MSHLPEQLLLEFLGPPLPHEERFPMNEQGSTVERVLTEDLLDSHIYYLFTGFTSLEYIASFLTCLPVDCEKEIFIILGDESRDMQTLAGNQGESLNCRIEKYWDKKGISVENFHSINHLGELIQAGKVQIRFLENLYSNLYVGDTRAVVGSSSFTWKGLREYKTTNVRFTAEPEANHDDTLRFAHLRIIADRFWAMAKDYHEPVLNLLKRLNQRLSWQESLAFALAELLEGKWIDPAIWKALEEMKLWPSQHNAVAQALYLLDRDNTMILADPGGAGKTRILLALRECLLRHYRKRRSLVIHDGQGISEWEQAEKIAPSDLGPLLTLEELERQSPRAVRLLQRSQLTIWDDAQLIYQLPIQKIRPWIPHVEADKVIISSDGPVPSDRDIWKWLSVMDPDVLPDDMLKTFEQYVQQGYKESSIKVYEDLEKWLATKTIARSRQALTEENDRYPLYLREQGEIPGRYPEIHLEAYPMKILAGEESTWKEIKQLCQDLLGIVYLQHIHISPESEDIANTLEAFIQQAKERAFSECWSRVRSSAIALYDYLAGTATMKRAFDLQDLPRQKETVGMLEKLENVRQQLPFTDLSKEDLPDWLSDPKAYEQACDKERYIYRRLAELCREVNHTFDGCRQEQLIAMTDRHSHLLICCQFVYTAWIYYQFLNQQSIQHKLIWLHAKDVREFQETFTAKTEEEPTVIFLYDDLPDGLRFSHISSVLHLDIPEKAVDMNRRVARFTHLNQGFAAIQMGWPAFPKEMQIRKHPSLDMVNFLEPYFSEVLGGCQIGGLSNVLYGEKPLIPSSIYDTMRLHPGKGLVSFVTASSAWAFFVIRYSNRAPQWIWTDGKANMLIEPTLISEKLRELLPGRENISEISDEDLQLGRKMLAYSQQKSMDLLSNRARRAVDVFRKLVRAYSKAEDLTPARQAVVTLWSEALFKRKSEETLDYQALAEQLIQKVYQPLLHTKKLENPAQIWHIRKLLPILKKEVISTSLLTDLYERRQFAAVLEYKLSACIIGLPREEATPSEQTDQ